MDWLPVVFLTVCMVSFSMKLLAAFFIFAVTSKYQNGHEWCQEKLLPIRKCSRPHQQEAAGRNADNL